jgi:hypothetical protein
MAGLVPRKDRDGLTTLMRERVAPFTIKSARRA